MPFEVYWLLLESLWYQIKENQNMFLFMTQLEMTANDTDVSPPISLPHAVQTKHAR